MNSKFSKLVLLICLAIFSSQVFAQEKPQAIKVDEFDDKAEKIESFAKKTNLFLQKISESPTTTTGVIAIYPKDPSLYKELFQKATTILSARPELKKRVDVIPVPGVRYNHKGFAQTEFILVTQGAESPSIPTCGLCICPTVEIKGKEFVEDFTKPLTFIADVRGGSQGDVTYKWTISAGEIIKGQDTPIITVELGKANVEKIIVSVEIGGVCEVCFNEFKFETKLFK